MALSSRKIRTLGRGTKKPKTPSNRLASRTRSAPKLASKGDGTLVAISALRLAQIAASVITLVTYADDAGPFHLEIRGSGSDRRLVVTDVVHGHQKSLGLP